MARTVASAWDHAQRGTTVQRAQRTRQPWRAHPGSTVFLGLQRVRAVLLVDTAIKVHYRQLPAVDRVTLVDTAFQVYCYLAA